MPRDEKGLYEKEFQSKFPPILLILKYLIVPIIIYPLYYVIMKSGKIDRIMGSIFTLDNNILRNSQSLSQTEVIIGNKK